ncbi:MAG TPA: hypothetical protein VF815_30890 [Myxococcaceae bacterium]|jgi:hypothetical protein
MSPVSQLKKAAVRLLWLPAALSLGACGVPTEEELLAEVPPEELMSSEDAVVGDVAVDMADYMLPACSVGTRAWVVGGQRFRTVPMGESHSFTRGKFVIMKSQDGDGFEEWSTDSTYLRIRMDRTWAYCVTPTGRNCAEEPGAQEIWCDVKCTTNNSASNCQQRWNTNASDPRNGLNPTAPWAQTVYVDPADTTRPAPFLHRKFNLAKGSAITLSTRMMIRAENRDTFAACATNFDTPAGVAVTRTVQYRRLATWQRWKDVMELTVTSGPGQGERSYYARGLGWVGFNNEVATDLVTFNSLPTRGNYTQGSVCSSGGNNPAYHSATNQHVTGRFREFWEVHGGLSVFGYPLGPAVPTKSESVPVLAQVFERMRFEYRPDLTPPYDVTLGRLGAEVLAKKGRVWQNEPPQATNTQKPGCRWFAETKRNLCGAFLTYWQNNGLRQEGPVTLTADQRSLARFGLPLTEERLETNPDGGTVVTQWFERARFEYHPNVGVLLGRLGAETGVTTP